MHLTGVEGSIGANPLLAIVDIGGNLPANYAVTTIIAHEIPLARVWNQRCESHTLNLATCRPFTVHEVSTPVYCYTRLTRQKATKDLLFETIEGTAMKEMPLNISFTEPTAEDKALLEIALNVCIAPIMDWSDEAQQWDTLGRLVKIRADVRENVGDSSTVFYRISCDQVSHACWTSEGRPCCDSTASVLFKLSNALKVVKGLLCSDWPYLQVSNYC